VHLNTMQGDVMTIEKGDSGLLWKHWDFRTDRAEIRRARKLVVSTICTVGNYEYALPGVNEASCCTNAASA
jgi:primary-amine oxidase